MVGDPPELGQCVKAPTEEVKGKTLGTGAYTKETCTSVSKKHNGLYNWESGVANPRFSSAEATTVSSSSSANGG